MKVCIVSDTFPPDVGGIQTFTYELARHLSQDERIERVSVVAFSCGSAGRKRVSQKLEVLRLPRTNFLKEGIFLIKHLLKKRDYDVFHSTTLLPAGFFTSHINYLFIRKKMFVTIYGLDILAGFRSRKSRLLLKRTLDKVDSVVAFSKFTGRQIKKLYRPKSKLKVIYPGVSVPEVKQPEIEKLRKKYSLREKDFIVLFVGRLVKRKGIDDLMRAIKNIEDERIKLLIVGDGPKKEELVELRKKFGLLKKVIFVGRIPYRNVFPFYKLSDVFCMPSKYLREVGDVEGLGIVFLEAQSYGVPVIGTKSGGIPEAIDENRSGFLVPENAPDAIADRLSELINDRKKYRKMKIAAVQFINENFSWKKCVNQHIKLYEGG